MFLLFLILHQTIKNVELIHPNFLTTHQEIHPGNDTLKKKLNSLMLNYLALEVSLWIYETHIQTSHPNRLVEILWPHGELMGSPWNHRPPDAMPGTFWCNEAESPLQRF